MKHGANLNDNYEINEEYWDGFNTQRLINMGVNIRKTHIDTPYPHTNYIYGGVSQKKIKNYIWQKRSKTKNIRLGTRFDIFI